MSPTKKRQTMGKVTRERELRERRERKQEKKDAKKLAGPSEDVNGETGGDDIPPADLTDGDQPA